MSSLNCKYCPKQPAAYLCENCDIGFCLHCVPEDKRTIAPRCTLCRQHLTSINSHQVVPAFWTQWLYFLRLPLIPSILTTLIIYAFLSLLLPNEGLSAVVFQGVYWGLLLMMLFELSNLLAEGRTDIISVEEIWQKGEPFLLIKLLIQVILVTMFIIGIKQHFGTWASLSFIILYGLGFPASVLLLALEKRFFSAVNPLRIIYVITAIGLPYLWLYVSWLSALGISVLLYNLQQDGHTIYALVAMFVSFYFWTVWFAILGYATYQYHQQLGIAVSIRHKHQRHQQMRSKLVKSKKQVVKSAAVKEAEILVIEQRPADAMNLLQVAMKEPMAEMDVHRFYLRLMVEQQESKRLASVSKQLVRQFIHQGNTTEAAHIAVIVSESIPDWRPELATDCFEVALGLVKMGRREYALSLFKQLMSNNDIPELMPQTYYEAAKLQAECFNQDRQAINYLQCIISDYPNNSIIEEVRTYLTILKSSVGEESTTEQNVVLKNTDDGDDALIIEENL